MVNTVDHRQRTHRTTYGASCLGWTGSQRGLPVATITLRILDKKGKELALRQVEFVRCGRDWIWVLDYADHEQPVGQYNNETGHRLGKPVHGKYLYRLPPNEIAEFRPFNKLAYIKRNKPVRPAPVKVEKVRKVKPPKYYWRVVLASGKHRMLVGKTKEDVIEKATRVSKGKAPQQVLSKIDKTRFRVVLGIAGNGTTEVRKLD